MPFVGVKVKRTSNQSIGCCGGSAIATFEVAEFDSGGFWNAAQPDRVIVPAGQGGKYRVIMSREAAGCELLRNGTTLLLHTHRGQKASGSWLAMGGLTWEGELAAGDVLQLREYNFGTGTIGTKPFLALYKIG